MTEYQCGLFEEEQFQLSEISYMQTDSDWIYLNYLWVNTDGSLRISRKPSKETKIRH